MSHRNRRLVLILAFAVACSVGAPSVAGARAKQRTPPSGFRVVLRGWVDGHCGGMLLPSKSFMLVSFAPAPTVGCASEFALFNDRTHVRWKVDTRPCLGSSRTGLVQVLAFGAPWAWFSCQGRNMLYNVRTRRWQRFPCVHGCQLAPDGATLLGQEIGARWAEFNYQLPGPCGDGVHNSCGPPRILYENLGTHRIRTARTTASTIIDLSSPALVRHLCAPLTVPRGGSLALADPFAVASDATGSFIERCGSRMKRSILPEGPTVAGGGILLSSHAVMWAIRAPSTGNWTGQFDGVSLPGLHRFSLRTTTSGSPAVALDNERLYVVNQQGGLSSAALPGG